MYSCRPADRGSLERIWNKNIETHPEEPSWVKWKEEFLRYNESGMGKSIILFCKDEPVGEITLLISPECIPINGRLYLADGKKAVNLNALRIDKPHRGKGLATKLIHAAEDYARENGFETVNIGVEAKESRNVAIYIHLGYTELIYHEIYEGDLILYYSKNL